MSAISGFCERCGNFLTQHCNGDRNTCMSILLNKIEALQQENEQLRAQVGKPTIEQVAWIAKCICQNADERGTFRYLIYDIMGYGGEAYQPLCGAGLLRINNSMLTADKDEQMKRLEGGLKKLRSSFQWLSESIRDLGYRAWAEDNIDKIDALLGGAEDVMPKR